MLVVVANVYTRISRYVFFIISIVYRFALSICVWCLVTFFHFFLSRFPLCCLNTFCLLNLVHFRTVFFSLLAIKCETRSSSITKKRSTRHENSFYWLLPIFCAPSVVAAGVCKREEKEKRKFRCRHDALVFSYRSLWTLLSPGHFSFCKEIFSRFWLSLLSSIFSLLSRTIF